MTGRAKLLVGLAGAGALVAAFFLLRDDDGAQGEAKRGETAQPDRDVPSTASGHPSRNLPPRGSGSDSTAPGEHAQPEVYEMEDGTRVADHRANPTPYIRPGVPHPSRSKLDGVTTGKVLGEVRPIVMRCLADIPTEAMAKDSVVMLHAVVKIDDAGNLTASELGADSVGIDSPKLYDAMQCIAKGAPEVAVHVDHAAVDEERMYSKLSPLAYR